MNGADRVTCVQSLSTTLLVQLTFASQPEMNSFYRHGGNPAASLGGCDTSSASGEVTGMALYDGRVVFLKCFAKLWHHAHAHIDTQTRTRADWHMYDSCVCNSL